MYRENKTEFIKKLEELCNMTRALEGLVIEPNIDVDKLMIRWKDQDPRFGRTVDIAGDSNYGILIDAMKVILKLA